MKKVKRKRLTKSERMEVYRKTGGYCAYCGCQLEYKDMHIDHMESLHNGGMDTLANMLPACRSCNHYKSSLSIEKFRKCIEDWPDALMRDSVSYKNAVRFGMVKPIDQKVIFYFER